MSYALTPADLIYGQRVATTPSGQQFDITDMNKTLTRHIKLNNFHQTVARGLSTKSTVMEICEDYIWSFETNIN